jgi:hypothetical protein
MALKTTNKNRKNTLKDIEWKPLAKLAPKETEESLKKFAEDRKIKW